VKAAKPTATPASGNQPTTTPIRQRHAPIEIGGDGITITFEVIPELPAIARASMTMHIIAESHPLGFLRMSASNTRTFLTELRNGCSPVVATGDEDGTVEIELEINEAGSVVLVRKPGQQDVLRRWVIDRRLDLHAMANELLADLGA
jgi:hypothetical protein